jgi:hypothetical protein
VKFKVKVFLNNLICQGYSISNMKNKVKEYMLVIVYNSETGEIYHLAESNDSLYKFEINGEEIMLSDDMADYLDEYMNTDILGFA